MKTEASRTQVKALAAAALLACLGAAQAQAQQPPVGQPAHQKEAPQDLLARLRTLYPATTFKSVSTTPWPGVFEVSMGANLAYVDGSGRHFLFGHLYDMREQRDLTAERRQNLARIDVQTLPLSDAITEVRGDGSRFLAIFSDPDCPYCKRLEVDLQDLTNVTIHTFVMPLVSLHPGARDKAVRVWCAAPTDANDPPEPSKLTAARIKAWHLLMRASSADTSSTAAKAPVKAAAECDHPIDRNVALGQTLGIHGTPTLVASDGRLMQGASGRDQVEAWLNQASSAASAAARTRASTTGAAPKTVTPPRKGQP
jgi:thiol:disulfide interchange protein DsbC